MQLLLSPQPFPEKNELPFPPHTQSKRIIQMMEEHPLSPLHPHEQFVADKSLISDLLEFLLQFIVCG